MLIEITQVRASDNKGMNFELSRLSCFGVVEMEIMDSLDGMDENRPFS